MGFFFFFLTFITFFFFLFLSPSSRRSKILHRLLRLAQRTRETATSRRRRSTKIILNPNILTHSSGGGEKKFNNEPRTNYSVSRVLEFSLLLLLGLIIAALFANARFRASIKDRIFLKRKEKPRAQDSASAGTIKIDFQKAL